MAATRWTDPASWTYANCSDNTKQPLTSHLLPTWKAASDERNAWTNLTHDSGFAGAETFPDFIGDLMNFGANSPKNSIRIKNAVWPEDVVETSTINSSGTFTNIAADFPDKIDLPGVLTGPLGYASGTLLHETETNGGDQNALFRMPWFVQWFEVMDYPQYYNRAVTDILSLDYFLEIERQYVEVEVIYKFNDVTSSFVSATAFLTTPLIGSTPVDIYVTNDLNESSPFSTHADVRDYADGLLAANSSTWANSTSSLGHTVAATISLDSEISSNITTFEARVTNSRIRFKVKDQFRATSPSKFAPDVWWNGFYQEGGGGGDPTYDFGSGETDKEMQFFKMSKVGDWYYLEVIEILLSACFHSVH